MPLNSNSHLIIIYSDDFTGIEPMLLIKPHEQPSISAFEYITLLCFCKWTARSDRPAPAPIWWKHLMLAISRVRATSRFPTEMQNKRDDWKTQTVV